MKRKQRKSEVGGRGVEEKEKKNQNTLTFHIIRVINRNLNLKSRLATQWRNSDIPLK